MPQPQCAYGWAVTDGNVRPDQIIGVRTYVQKISDVSGVKGGVEMKKTVHKFVIEDGFDIAISMPKGAEILSVQNQNGNIAIWALVIPSNEPEQRCFEIYGTGHPMHCDMGIERNFIGTVQIGGLVFHVFERVN
jgi:hypothetical protein